MLLAIASIARSRRTAPTGFSVPTINFTAGVGSSHDMTQYVPGWDAAAMDLIVLGTLPASVTFDGTNLVYDGTGGATSVSGITLHIVADGEPA